MATSSAQAPRRASLLPLFLVCACARLAAAVPTSQSPIRLDCGSASNVTDAQGLLWAADAFYGSNGTAQHIGAAYTDGGLVSLVDRSLRSWSTGESCYSVPVAHGRYLVRLSFLYNNYDGNFFVLFPENALPVIGVVLNGQLVEQWATSGFNSTAYYTDYIAYSAPQAPSSSLAAAGTEYVSICLAALQGVPYINSLQVLPVDTDAYWSSTTGTSVVLSTWQRVNSGSSAVLGPETNGDPGFRTWAPDVAAQRVEDPWVPVSTSTAITIPARYAALNLPPALFQTARKAGSLQNSTGYNITGIRPVDPSDVFLVVLYFAEIEEGVVEGQREMSLWVNGQEVTVDILAATGGAPFTAVVVNLQVHLGGLPSDVLGQWVAVLLRPTSPGMLPPILSGVEVYEIIPALAPPTLVSTQSGGKETEIRIDCGGEFNFTDSSTGFSWLADTGFSSGQPSIVTSSDQTNMPYASSLRYFPVVRENCYSIPVPPGRYFVRGFFDYGNYDLKNQAPIFSIAVESTIVVVISPQTPGAFEDMLAYVEDGEATFCLVGDAAVSNLPPLINSLEVLQVHAESYHPEITGNQVVLYNYFRITCGGQALGVEDLGHRQWFADVTVLGLNRSCSPVCTVTNLNPASLAGVDVAPDFLPRQLFATAMSASKAITYSFGFLDPGSSLLLVLYFAETEQGVKAGERAFAVLLDGQPIPGLEKVDLAVTPGINRVLYQAHAFVLSPNATTATLVLVALPTSTLGPMISGVELYRVLPQKKQTVGTTRAALTLMRDAMVVPESSHWQGDPCTPMVWPGISCIMSQGNSSWDVEALSLPSGGLSGTIPEAISNLGQLTSLNLSNNALTGAIPSSITSLTKLATIDLSYNKLNSTIPPGLATMPSLHLLFLNDNELMGEPVGLVPPPNGLTVNLANNPYLCGLGALPSCASIHFPGSGTGNLTELNLASGSSSAPVGLIVGLVLGGIALILLVVGAVLLWRRRQMNRVSFDPSLTTKGIFDARSFYSKTNMQRESLDDLPTDDETG